MSFLRPHSQFEPNICGMVVRWSFFQSWFGFQKMPSNIAAMDKLSKIYLFTYPCYGKVSIICASIATAEHSLALDAMD